MQQVIARFSMGCVGVCAFGASAMLALLCKDFIPPLLFLPLALVVLLGGLLYRGKAIWIENGQIFSREGFLSRAVSHPVEGMADVAMGSESVYLFFTMPSIVLTRSNRSSTRVMAWALTERSAVVLARLRDALGLPKMAA